jgi:hypothetical protein
MEAYGQQQLQIVQSLIAYQQELAREVRRTAQKPSSTNRRSVRRSVGQSLVRLGERLAAEPSLTPTGSR